MSKFADWFDDVFSRLYTRYPKLGDFLYAVLILGMWVFCILFVYWYCYLFKAKTVTGTLATLEKEVTIYRKDVRKAFKTAQKHVEPDKILVYKERQHPIFATTIYTLKGDGFYVCVNGDYVTVKIKKVK